MSLTLPSRRDFASAANHLAAVATEIAGPALRLTARALARGAATAPARWRRGVVLGHAHIGDVLYRTASLGALARAFPECDWDYVAAPDSAEVLRGNPNLREVLPLYGGDGLLPLAPRAAASLRRRRYDAALCTNTLRHGGDLVLASALGIPNRVAFSGRGLSALITHPVPLGPPAPYPAYFRGMVAHLASVAPRWSLRPEVYPGPEDERAADAAWRELGLGAGRAVVACTLTTRQPGELWPLDHWLRALDLLQAQLAPGAVHVVLCGAASDAPILAAARARLVAPASVLAGALGLRAFAAFLRRCALLFGTDSGPRHLANAVGTPVAFMRSLLPARVETGVYCDTEVDLAPPDERVPPHRAGEVWAKVSPEAVVPVLRRLVAARAGL